MHPGFVCDCACGGGGGGGGCEGGGGGGCESCSNVVAAGGWRLLNMLRMSVPLPFGDHSPSVSTSSILCWSSRVVRRRVKGTAPPRGPPPRIQAWLEGEPVSS